MSQLLQVASAVATAIKPGNLPTANAGSGTVQDILRVAFAIIGALSLLMITISGLRYITAGGDAQKVSKAKNGIIYALLGLIIAISAQAIVSYVVEHVAQGTP